MAKSRIPALKMFCKMAIGLAPLMLTQMLAAQTSDPQALALAQQAMVALNHGLPVSDVTLTGTVTQTAGSWARTGQATLKSLGTAQTYAKSRVDFSASGQSEIRTLDTNGHPAGAWIRSDGRQYSMAMHNGFTDAAWFFPSFSSLRIASQQGIVARYVGAETHNGVAVNHLRFWRTADSSLPRIGDALPHLSAVDVYLATNNNLPVAVAFNAHTERNMTIDVPVEVHFSDYRTVSGISVPFHVQRYLNGGLITDFQATQVLINSGLTDAQFSVQ